MPKISEMEVVPFSLPYTSPFRMASGVFHAADNVLVKIIADNGLIGLGETQPVPGVQECAETQASVVDVIQKIYSPLLLGRDPSELERIMQDLDSALSGCRYATAAVCNGLYDLLARSLNIPLYKLLGGLCYDRIEMVWPIGMKSTTETEQEARFAMKRGYRKIKIKVGSSDPTQDIESVFAARRALGNDVSLRVDANGAYTFLEALGTLRAMKRVHLDLIEQPLASWDFDGSARLSTQIDIPIMADESCTTVQSALELVKKQAASVFDIKLEKNGGIHPSRKITALAQAANILLYAGSNPGSTIGAATAAHFFASIPHVIGGDFNVGQTKSLMADIAQKPLEIRGAFALVPDGIGIGVDLDEKKLAQYAVSLS